MDAFEYQINKKIFFAVMNHFKVIIKTKW